MFGEKKHISKRPQSLQTAVFTACTRHDRDRNVNLGIFLCIVGIGTRYDY